MSHHRYFAAALAAVIVALLPGASALAQSNSKEIMALPQEKLIELAQNAQAPIFERGKACQRLAIVGTKDAVPALAALLADESLNHYARFGLEGIPDPAVDAALREAAGKLQGRPLLGVIGSLGQRKDEAALDLLKGFLASKDAPTATAAALALGTIGSANAGAALQDALGKDSAAKNDVGAGCLICAERLALAGNKAEALKLYEFVAGSGLPKHLRVGAVAGQCRLLGIEGKDLLITQLRSEDVDFFNVGLLVAREIPGRELTGALAEQLDKLPAERQALLLRAMSDRPGGAPAARVLAATKSDSPEVREAAIYVLARSGDAAAAEVLLDVALGEGDIAQVARDGLESLSGDDINNRIVEKLTKANAKQKAVLLGLIGARQILTAEPAAREALRDTDEQIRVAALGALGQLIELKDFDLLLSRALDDATNSETAAAQAALAAAAQRMGDREACATVLAARLDGVSAGNQAYLLELLGKVSGQKALATVVNSTKASDPALKDSATKVLGDWNNPDAAAALLELAKSDPQSKYQIRALRGYIRIARQLQLPDDARVQMYQTAMEVAQRPDEKQLALDILTRAPSPEALSLAVARLDEPELKEQAADAAVKIAGKLVDRNPQPVASAMEKVASAKVNATVDAKAKQLGDRAKSALPQ